MNAGTPKEGTKYFMSGCPFVAPGEQTWDLAKLKLVGGSYYDDTLSLLRDTMPVVDSNKNFQYWSADEEGEDNENVGWYFLGGENDGQKVESYPVPIGTGFLVYLFSTGATFTYNGEVVKGDSNGEIVIEKVDGQLYRFISNPVPAEIDLTDIKLVGGSYYDETISFLKPTMSVVDPNKNFQYWSADEEGEDNENVGWYYNGGEYDGQKVEKDDVKLGAGEAVFAYLFTPGVKVVFKAPAL